MKKKNNSSDLVTKVFLKGELTTLETRVDIKLERMEKRIDDNAQKYRDQVLTSNDKLAKHLKTMREENTIGFNQLNNKLQDHEKRIQRIERTQQTS